MVLYHANGRVVIAHERYLEHLAQKEAQGYGYINQVDLYNRRNEAPTNEDQVKIIIEEQSFRTALCDKAGSDWENLDAFDHPGDSSLASVDRATLMAFSSLAEDHFQYNPGDSQLRLPVRYPRLHHFGSDKSDSDFAADFPGQAITGKLINLNDSHMAYIRGDEIKDFIIPWLREAEEKVKKGSDQPNPTPASSNKLPQIRIPDDLLRKIHLYNAMSQLGLPKPVQKPLIDALVLQMYETNLNACHLNTVEMTIGRFQSKGLAILDPVLNHFAGTYAFRTPQDRTNPGSASLKAPRDDAGEPPTKVPGGFSKRKRADGSSPDDLIETDYRKSHRRYLEYAEQPVRRRKDLQDTYIMPPVLPVLGHTIRHWTGLRRDGSTSAAFTGFPLNVGKGKKFVRTTIQTTTAEDVETNHLRHQEAYQKNDPGHLPPHVLGPGNTATIPPSS